MGRGKAAVAPVALPLGLQLTNDLKAMRGKRTSATSMMNLAIIAYKLGEENEW